MSGRNSQTERLCPACRGAGVQGISDPDPEREAASEQRCMECLGAGWIRWAPIDPLVQIRNLRLKDRRRLPAERATILRDTPRYPLAELRMKEAAIRMGMAADRLQFATRQAERLPR